MRTQGGGGKEQEREGGGRAAAAVGEGKEMASNISEGGAAGITMEGQAVTLINGYPTADLPGIQTALQITNASEDINITVGGAGPGSLMTIDINGGTVPNCRVNYTSPAAGNSSPIISVDPSA